MMQASDRLLTIFLAIIVLSMGQAGSMTARAQSTDAHVYGKVVDGSGTPLPYVNVVLEGTIEGAATDNEGMYEFTTSRTGLHTIIVSMIGYESMSRAIELRPESIELDFVLKETLINMEEAVVTASSYVTGIEDAATLNTLEVVTTPGAAADILLAIKTFPGTAMVDEGAGLFVRGGDVNETVLHLDQATVIHPYKYESPTGGVFGTIPPFLVEWFLEASISASRYQSNRTLGLLDLEQTDWAGKIRFDAERDPAEGQYRILTGVEVEQLENRFTGILPSRDDILDPGASSYQVQSNDLGTRFGGYGELEWKWSRRIATRVGGRFDKLSLSDQWTFDPRASLLFAIDADTEFRMAWGIYHQYALPYQYATSPASLNLKPQRSQHFIAGVHIDKERWQARLEGYLKPYDRLVVENAENDYTNEGEGIARGVDAFFKYGGFLLTRVNGWVSYSYLTSNRTQQRYTSSGAVFERGPSPFDISHNLTLVAKARVVGFWSTGFTYRYATGRPITPVTSAFLVEDQGYYLPIQGPVGSERLPSFQRLDMNVSYYLPFGKGLNATFYFAVSNLLNRVNVLGYDYSADYSQRTERRSNYKRFVYFGVSMNINRLPNSL